MGETFEDTHALVLPLLPWSCLTSQCMHCFPGSIPQSDARNLFRPLPCLAHEDRIQKWMQTVHSCRNQCCNGYAFAVYSCFPFSQHSHSFLYLISSFFTRLPFSPFLCLIIYSSPWFSISAFFSIHFPDWIDFFWLSMHFPFLQIWEKLLEHLTEAYEYITMRHVIQRFRLSICFKIYRINRIKEKENGS